MIILYSISQRYKKECVNSVIKQSSRHSFSGTRAFLKACSRKMSYRSSEEFGNSLTLEKQIPKL